MQKGKKKIYTKILVVILTFTMLIPLFMPTVSAVDVPTGKQITKQITSTYNRALQWWGRENFAGWCGHYVNLQLLFRGINASYVGGDGNTEFDNYKNITKTSGGRKVHAYPATTAELGTILRKIASNANVVTDILLGFEWTSSAAGNKYGHTFFIHAIIDGYVYFSDNFAVEIGGITYREGTPIKCTIDELVAYYGREKDFGLEGIVWFEDEELTAKQQNYTLCEAVYMVNSKTGLRLRSGPGLGYEAISRMPDETVLLVVAISEDGWGKVVYNGVEGWCSLDYCKLMNETLPKSEGASAIYEVDYTTGLRLRTGPSTEYDRILTMPHSTRIEVLEVSSNNWARIIYNGIEGWCSLDYCKFIETVENKDGEKPEINEAPPEPEENVPNADGEPPLSRVFYEVNYPSGLNLRSAPGTNNKRLLTMPKGTKIEVLETSSDGWGRIIYNNIEGWCALEYCTAIDVEPTGITNYRVSSSIGLRMRTGPGTDNSVILKLPDGLEIEVMHTSYNGWGQIVYNGQVGWCSLEYCEKIF